jgi:hypothetical protein
MTSECNEFTVRLHVRGTFPSAGAQLPIILAGVAVRLIEASESTRRRETRAAGVSVDTETDAAGYATVAIDPHTYRVEIVFGKGEQEAVYPCGTITIRPDVTEYAVDANLAELQLTWSHHPDSDGTQFGPNAVLPYGKNIYFMFSGAPLSNASLVTTILFNGAETVRHGEGSHRHPHFTSAPGILRMQAGIGTTTARPEFPGSAHMSAGVAHPEPTPIEGGITVGMRRTASRYTEDVPLWVAIRKSTDSLHFGRYDDFMNWLFCGERENPVGHARSQRMFDRVQHRALPFTDTDAYRNIKFATEAFVMANCGIHHNFNEKDARYVIDLVNIPLPDGLDQGLNEYLRPLDGGPDRILPYLAVIRRKLKDQRVKDIDIGDVMLRLKRDQVDACYGLLRQRLTCPCLLELIWSYWQEEGMLVQTMNVLARRFQNVRASGASDPLANMAIDPLRPLNNLVWGYIQDEQHRLSVVRRNYEYDQHYALRLAGRAVGKMRTADSRSKFLESFHTLLSITSAFYKRDDDTTIVADGFGVLNALKEVHLILTQGMDNQFGDLPSTARIEMLMQQWILSRPEFREFLPTRIMVDYPEPWMDRVDAMKKLQGWSDTSVLHFRNLANFGEQILLSIRFGVWSDVNDPYQGSNWARYWRAEIQGYMHAYRSVTGVDLSVDVTNARIDATMPSVHLVRRLTEQLRTA